MKYIKLALITLFLVSSAYGEKPEPRSRYEMVQDLHSRMMDGVERHDWDYVIHHSRLLATRFMGSPYANDAYYYMGVAYYQGGEYFHANKSFTNYLHEASNPKFFEEALEYKFDIATKYVEGNRKRAFGKRRLPKLFSAKEDALTIYDEVITSMPRHDMATLATFKKGELLTAMQDYALAIETFQTLIRRYPKHPLATDSYLAISRVFLDQAKKECPDQELLDRAELNYEKFKDHFPKEPRLEIAAKVSDDIREVLAEEFFTLGDFFQRTKKPRAAVIYYSNIVTKYPRTSFASKAKKRLQALKGTFAELKAPLTKKQKAVIAESGFDERVENDKMVDMIDSLVL